MTENVFVSGIASGAFKEAVDGLPPWATENTAGRIESHLRKSLDIQTKTLSELIKSVSKGAAGAGSTGDFDKALKRVVKGLADQDRENKKKLKRDKEEAEKEKKRSESEANWNAKLVAGWGALLAVSSAIKSVFADNINTFDQLYNAGINVVDGFDSARSGFDSLQQMAALTGVRYTELAKTMEKYSSAVNSFGAAKFAKTMSMASLELIKFGYSTKDTGELLGAYLEIQQGFSSANSKTQEEVREDVIQFGKRITNLSLATGIARNKLIENVDAISKSVEATILSGQASAAATDSTLAFIGSFKDKNVGQAFLRMMTDSIKPLNATFMSFQKLGLGGFGQKLMSFTQSLVGLEPEEASARLNQFVASNRNEMDRMVKQANMYRQLGMHAEAEDVLAKIAGMRQAAATYKKIDKADKEKLEATNTASAKLRTSYEKFMAQLQITFAPMTSMLDGITYLLDIVSSGITKVRDGINAIGNYIDSFLPATSKFDGKLASILGSVVGGLIVSIASMGLAFASVNKVLNIFGKGVDIKKMLSRGAEQAAGAADTGRGAGRGRGRPGKGGGIGDALGGILTGLGKGGGALIQGVLSGIAAGLGAFANPKVLVGAGILSGSIAILAAGLSASAWMLGKTLPDLAAGLDSFKGLDGNHLVMVGAGIASLAAGMAVFTATSVLATAGNLITGLADGIGALFGNKSIIDKIKIFADMGVGLNLASTAIGVLSDNLTKASQSIESFTGIDKLKELVATINSIDIIKALAIGSIFNTGVSLPAMSGGGVASATTPKKSTLNSPSKVSAIDTNGQTPKATTAEESVAPGTEKKPVDTANLGGMITYQSSILEQLLLSTNNLVSVNKDILRYTRASA